MSTPPVPAGNRLARETSPYLLQHAQNPVDWYPWGEEAFQAARDQNRPIFLSIGYSACHWCHVMEHESFENPALAAVMNEHFVNIKVDREERPDLDQIYMQAVQLLTGRGGWPMSVFLTSAGQPFYGGTYWPPERRGQMPGFREILLAVHDAWVNRPDAVQENATQLTAGVIQSSRLDLPAAELQADLLRDAGTKLCRNADPRHGGFGHAPKFPHSMDLRVLWRCWKRFHNEDALNVARLTLDKMAAGGIYDHLGGGFHRYSTDERWLVPHFEKMLYDNALLVPAYLEGWQITQEPRYLAVVRETLDYVLREMLQPGGGFYSTQDADSEGVEGKFFVWSEAEVLELLGPEEGRQFCYCYDITSHGNWEEANILNRPKSHAQAAQVLGVTEEELAAVLERGRARLLETRSQRIPPGRDDKILASWNGLMLSALAQAAWVLNEPRYRTAAAETADFLLQTLLRPDGRLWHSYKDGQARFNAYLDDYAALCDGLIDVYQATFEARYLSAATQLAETMLREFYDPAEPGFFYTSSNHEQLLTRQKDYQDNATPSGNSLAASALLRLGTLTGRSDFSQTAESLLKFLAPLAAKHPSAAGQMLIAFDLYLGPIHEVVIASDNPPHDWQQAVGARFAPQTVWAWRSNALTDAELPAALKTVLSGKAAPATETRAYVCQQGACGAPQGDLPGTLQQLGLT